MVRLDRYILAQLMGPFGLFSLILIGVYWVNRAIGIFDQLIGDGQSVTVFLELVVLFLPQVIAIVLPMVSFIAAVYVANRLHSDSEIVVLLGAGVSPYRLIRPFIIFSLLVAVLSGLLSHYLVPVSRTEMAKRQLELSQDLASRLIVDGKFLHPSPGITFYIREVQGNGELFDIFLNDQRSPRRTITYTAQKAVLLKEDGLTKLVMFDGLVQTLELADNRLGKVEFADFTVNISSFIEARQQRKPTAQDYSTLQLLRPTAEMINKTGLSRANFIYEANDRLVQPLHVLIYPLIGMSVLMLGGFSRFGVARQITLAVLIIVGLNLLISPTKALVLNDISYWPILYLPDLIGAVLVGGILYLSSRQKRGLFNRLPAKAKVN